MIKVDLFNELIEDQVISVSCEMQELKSLLMSKLNEAEIENQKTVILFSDKNCVLYMKSEAGTEGIRVEPAARIRIETKEEKRLDKSIYYLNVKNLANDRW